VEEDLYQPTSLLQRKNIDNLIPNHHGNGTRVFLDNRLILVRRNTGTADADKGIGVSDGAARNDW